MGLQSAIDTYTFPRWTAEWSTRLMPRGTGQNGVCLANGGFEKVESGYTQPFCTIIGYNLDGPSNSPSLPSLIILASRVSNYGKKAVVYRRLPRFTIYNGESNELEVYFAVTDWFRTNITKIRITLALGHFPILTYY